MIHGGARVIRNLWCSSARVTKSQTPTIFGDRPLRCIFSPSPEPRALLYRCITSLCNTHVAVKASPPMEEVYLRVPVAPGASTLGSVPTSGVHFDVPSYEHG